MNIEMNGAEYHFFLNYLHSMLQSDACEQKINTPT